MSLDSLDKDLEEVAQRQKLELIGRLSSGIAHDFNNILTNIFGYSDLIRKNSPHDTKVEKYLDRIQETTQRGSHLVQQLLSFARHENREPEVFYADTLVKECLSLYQNTFPQSIRFSTEMESGLKINVDPIQFEQVLLNLCGNARDALGSVGTINLILREYRQSELQLDHFGKALGREMLELIVEDDGSGIPEEILSKIFQPFFTTKNRNQGSGLGLAIVENIIEKYKAQIKICSSSKGTAFHIYWPKHKIAKSSSPDV
jgi:signal transduction histidine kinase